MVLKLSRLHRRRTKASRGFTLIELMYASGYFMMGLVGLVYFQSMGAQSVRHAYDTTMATNLTTSAIEGTRLTAPTDVLARGQPFVTYFDRYGSPTGQASYYTVQVTATQTPGNTFYDLAAVCSWKEQPTATFTHTLSMQTRVAIDG